MVLMLRQFNHLKRKRKPIRQRYPFNMEREYIRKLIPLVNRLRELAQTVLKPALPQIIASYNRARDIKADSYYDELSNTMKAYKERFYGTMTDAEVEQIAGAIEDALNRHNLKQNERVFSAAVGKPIYVPSRYPREIESSFIKRNVNLIKTIPSRYFDQVEMQVESAIRSGTGAAGLSQQIDDIMAAVESRVEVAQSNSERIARDQIGKYNSELNHTRQTSMGVTSYIWRTVGDDRVRDEHDAREGKTFLWAAPPDDGHAGEPINCRCYPEPIFSELEENEE